MISRDKGFTLIELLLTVTLLGAIASVLYGGFFLSLKMHTKAVQLHELNRAVYGLSKILENDAYNYLNGNDIGVDSEELAFNAIVGIKGAAGLEYLCDAAVIYRADLKPDSLIHIVRIVQNHFLMDSTIYILPKGYAFAFLKENPENGRGFVGFAIYKAPQIESYQKPVYRMQTMME